MSISWVRTWARNVVTPRPRPAPSSLAQVKETPLLGSLRPFTIDRLRFLSHVAESCGDVGAFHLGPFRAVLLNSPELVRAVLVENEDAFDKGWILRHVPRSVLGNGLLFSEGEFHHQQRKQIAPVLGPRSIGGYADTIVASVGSRLRTWGDSMTLDVDREMGELALTILNQVLFSENIFSSDDALGKLIVAPRRSMRDVGLGILMLSLGFPMPGSVGVRHAILESRRRIEQLIVERQRCSLLPDDILGALMRARDKDGTSMSHEAMRDEALTLFLAGQRNTTDALAWSFALVAANPGVELRIQGEVDRVLGGNSPAYADLPRLPYALQVCKEALRLYPPAYIIGRTALRSVSIGRYEVRRGDMAFISPYTMHRRPDYYPEPDSFDPDRFTQINEGTIPRYAYIPFGVGPRVCIGNHLTVMAMHLALVSVMQHFSLSLPKGPVPSLPKRQQLEHEIVFTLRPKRGTEVVVQRRADQPRSIKWSNSHRS